jgi:hypothetical protein
MSSLYAIVYERPDGWWVAGHSYESEHEGFLMGQDHDWGGNSWKVVREDALPLVLCEEGLVDWYEELEKLEDEND